MTTTSLTPAVIDYLVNAANSSASLGASTTARVTIHDGPLLTGDSLVEPRHLYIGWDAVNGAGEPTAVQSFPVMDKTRTKDEDGTLICTADAWTGTTVMKTARDMCKNIVAAVELLLRGDGTTGPGDSTMGGLVFWSGVDQLTWHPQQSPNGAACACVFTIVYRSRIVTTGA